MAAAPSSASASRGAPGEGPVTPVAGLCTSRAGEASICIRGGGTVLDFAPKGAGVLADGVPVAEPPAADREARLRSAQEREDSAVGHIEALRAATLREVEALLHDAQAQAQAVVDAARERDMAMLRDTEALTARMQVEAAELVAGATASAESLISAAKDQESVIRTEIDRLIQSRLRLVEDIRGTLDTYDQWLSTVAPRARAQSGDAFEVSNEGHERADAPDEARVG